MTSSIIFDSANPFAIIWRWLQRWRWPAWSWQCLPRFAGVGATGGGDAVILAAPRRPLRQQEDRATAHGYLSVMPWKTATAAVKKLAIAPHKPAHAADTLAAQIANPRQHRTAPPVTVPDSEGEQR